MRMPVLPAVVAAGVVTGTSIGAIVLASGPQPAPSRHDLITRASWEDGAGAAVTGTSSTVPAGSVGPAGPGPVVTGRLPTTSPTPAAAPAGTSFAPGGAVAGDGSADGTVSALPTELGAATGDSAVFRNPDHPERSLVMVAAGAGLAVYRLDGTLASTVSTGAIGGVDLRVISIAGKRAALVEANDRSGAGLRFWLLDPESGALVRADAREITTGKDAQGSCLGTTPDGGHVYALVAVGEGVVEQYELWSNDGRVDATLVRTVSVGSPVGACAVDDVTGALYVAETGVGIWRYGVDPAAGTARTSVDRVGGGHLTGAVTGLDVVRGARGGVVVAAGRDGSSIVAYDADGSHAVRGGSTADSSTAGVSGAVGVAGVAGYLGAGYPEGLLIRVAAATGTPGSVRITRLDRLVDLTADSTATPTPSGASSSTSPSVTPSAGPTTAPAPTGSPTPTGPAAVGASGTFTGSAVTTEFGAVQVRITVSGGRITRADAVQHPSGDAKSEEINARAVPALNAQVTGVQSAMIDAVGGATITSNAYKLSLQAALEAAHL